MTPLLPATEPYALVPLLSKICLVKPVARELHQTGYQRMYTEVTWTMRPHEDAKHTPIDRRPAIAAFIRNNNCG